jgi:hypothetical protein
MMTYGNVNVDTVTTSTAGGVLGAGNASIMKNRIINGSFVIDQRNAGAATTNTINGYTVDRWAVNQSVTGKVIVQQNAGSVTPPVGFANYLGITSQSAYTLLSGSYYMLNQPIEGFNTADLQWGTANAKTVTLSFWVYSSLTGTFGGSLQNSAQNRSYPFAYTISSASTWEQKSITIAGDTSGTWIGATNGLGILLNIGLGVGTTYSGTAGSWAGTGYLSATGATSVVGTSGATFYITGVQLEVGSSATGYEYRQYGTELSLCQRYYQVYTSTGGGLGLFYRGTASAGGSISIPILYPVVMRATATITIGSGWTNSNTAGLTTSGGNSAIPGITFASTSGGDAYTYGGTWNASAEL